MPWLSAFAAFWVKSLPPHVVPHEIAQEPYSATWRE
jgi:hypothetical protein